MLGTKARLSARERSPSCEIDKAWRREGSPAYLKQQWFRWWIRNLLILSYSIRSRPFWKTHLLNWRARKEFHHPVLLLHWCTYNHCLHCKTFQVQTTEIRAKQLLIWGPYQTSPQYHRLSRPSSREVKPWSPFECSLLPDLRPRRQSEDQKRLDSRSDLRKNRWWVSDYD